MRLLCARLRDNVEFVFVCVEYDSVWIIGGERTSIDGHISKHVEFLESVHGREMKNAERLSFSRGINRIRPISVYLESDRGHRGLASPREDSEVVLYEGAVAELYGRPGGHVVEAVLGYPAPPFHPAPPLRPVVTEKHRQNKEQRKDGSILEYAASGRFKHRLTLVQQQNGRTPKYHTTKKVAQVYDMICLYHMYR